MCFPVLEATEHLATLRAGEQGQQQLPAGHRDLVTVKDSLRNLPLLVDSNIQGVFWVLFVLDRVCHAVEQVEVHGLVGWDFHVLEQVPQLGHLFEAVQAGEAGQSLDFLEKLLKI